ncbi:deoxyribodipyrimidine photolyase-related protein [Fluviicoccus keumensis]|uniref:Deoxyribodipyrimidine photolyase-related protein n=1 Tax=Fluviicoccus keumensis TaxID=1435465 RepID=A0A4Q7YPR3_9GAMM|nr:cryptochrome/photolyase family protein [Fluviicoccus keumensis]RZU38705.1 deoxyribodipyrimidine photolyase-related protein [Fluviicoccus keumensis]
MTTLRLILGDQLNPRHRWFDQIRPDVLYVLMEIRQETDYVLHHAQKILAIFAAMRDFARQLKEAGHRVRYIAIDDASNRQSLPANLDALIAHYDAAALEYQHPDEWRLDRQLADYAAAAPIPVRAVDSDHFYTSRDEAAGIFAGRRQWLMEHFYRTLRQRHGVLLTADGKPEGGQWNFDQDNRKPWRGEPPEPPDRRRRHDHRALWQTITDAGVKSFGNPSAEAFPWPLNRAEALADLDDFLTQRLPHFGDYQDAMSRHATNLFHSLLSFALNVKLLDPREVVERAEAAWRAGRAPLAAVEGFIRQILGWREYVRGVYWARMPGYDTLNALDHHTPLPRWFWDGQTKMRCLAHAIGQSLDTAYAHHIQRLMITGNFALLAGVDPAEVHRWYLGIYIDAFEWVELPNTLGMSQFADGGLLATKPYVSGAAYIDRMSDYCRDCPYDRKQRVGEKACPFNALYWDFFDRHRERLGRNPRLGMVYRTLEKMGETEVTAIRERAVFLRARLDEV